MNLTGIITEYNPFHNGHLLHLNAAKTHNNSDGIICIMSGNFVQRGEAALLDKWSRTQMALENGVDLVIELPTYYAVSSAENFAFGSIAILNSLNCVNDIFFGSECGDVNELKKIANILTYESNEYKGILKYYLKKGLSFPSARENALFKILNSSNLDLKNTLSSSNNILGIEYIKALIKLDSSISPKTFKREGSNYNDVELNSCYSSATSIRKSLEQSSNNINLVKDYLPINSTNILNQKFLNSEYFSKDKILYNLIKYKLITNCVNFNNLSDVSEGIENKILKEIYYSKDLNDLILRCKSKRYTYTKLSRLLIKIFIGFENYNEEDLKDINNLYCRVLGFNSKGRDILKIIKQTSTIPIITNVGKYPNNKLLELDIQATRAYSILDNKLDSNADFFNQPVILK